MKRIAVAALWAFAFWYLGAFIALTLAVSDLLGPILGAAAGLLIAVDPRRVVFRPSRIVLPKTTGARTPA